MVLLVLFVCQERAFEKPRLQRPAGGLPPGIQRVRRELENAEQIPLPPGIRRVRRELENAEQVNPLPPGIRRVRRGVNLENPQQKPFPPEGFF